MAIETPGVVVQATPSPRIRRSLITTLIGLAALTVFWCSAYPDITWWDSSSYSLATSTLAVVGPPGSLLLTLLGWPVAHLSFVQSPAHALNLLAGALAALTVVMVFVVALRLLTLARNVETTALQVGAGIGALTLGFATTTWEYAVQFTPYILTTVFTTLILLTLLRWWERAYDAESWRDLALLGFLFGLDFSVHRTNSLLMPSVLAWILIRNAGALRDWRAWVGGGGALLLGVSTQLLLIPISRYAHSPLSWNDTSTLTGLWQFISLERLGGGFLVSFFPRKAPFWSAQVFDVVRTLRDNFLDASGVIRGAGTLAGVAGVAGMVLLYRRDKRLGTAYLLVLILQASATVLYFNIPDHFFRSLDRHYLPICVTFGVAMAYGVGALVNSVATARPGSGPWLATAAAALLVLPGVRLVNNWSNRTASNRYFAADYARNALEELPPNAIFFTVGDNDTFPLLYLQAVEGVRPDVQLVNFSLLFDPTYVEQLIRADSTFPLGTAREPRSLGRYRWGDSTLTLHVVGSAESLGLSATALVPPMIALHPKGAYSDSLMLGDMVLVDLVRTNAWRRPLTFSITMPEAPSWLTSFTRLDGLHFRLVPVEHAAPDASTLRANLFSHNFRGFADSAVVIDDFTRNIGHLYVRGFEALLDADAVGDGGLHACREDLARALALLPPERLGMPEADRRKFQARCN